jgi:5-hydroxyisourate hydrolase-like protein (transthyretin family)
MSSASSLRRFSLLLAGLMLPVSLFAAQDQHRGRKYVAPPPTSRITVTVLKEKNGKPVEDASVIFHSVNDGKDQGNMELKTNEDGKAVIDVIPIGDTVELQIIARGFQTFGQDYPIKTGQKAITVKLVRPVRQYSIYQAHTAAERGIGGAGTTEPPAPAANSSNPH